MKLRYLRLRDLPPLDDLRVVFARDNILDRECSIRFVVGVNGSGKTRLLQALAEAFLALDRPVLPPFPITLAYDLGTGDDRRTIYLRHQGAASDAVLLEFDHVLDHVEDWDELSAEATRDPERYPLRTSYSGDRLPSMAAYLPSVLLAYTSGAPDRWDALFAQQLQVTPAFPDEITPEAEQPAGASDALRPSTPADESSESGQPSSERRLTRLQLRTSSLGMFVRPQAMRLAICAATLAQAIKDFESVRTTRGEAAFLAKRTEAFEGGKRAAGLRGLLDMVRWLWPVTISFRVGLDLERLTDDQQRDLAGLYEAATAVIADPGAGSGRRLVFDLRAPSRVAGYRNTAEALSAAVMGEGETRAFEIFGRLYRWQADGWLRDVDLAVKLLGVNDVLLYDWLSDGEKVFLSRMALFHLLHGQAEALMILDEPETHFNDFWKRQIVDIIDDSLKNDAIDVLISTHSSIALTDVFEDEITLLRQIDGTVSAGPVTSATFGADPSEIMIGVFDAPSSMGQRALEWLDTQLERPWHVDELPRLEHLLRHIGPGYYRSELRSIWRRLRAASDQ